MDFCTRTNVIESCTQRFVRREGGTSETPREKVYVRTVILDLTSNKRVFLRDYFLRDKLFGGRGVKSDLKIPIL